MYIAHRTKEELGTLCYDSCLLYGAVSPFHKTRT